RETRVTAVLSLRAPVRLPLRTPGVPQPTRSAGGNLASGAASDAISAAMVDMEAYACLRACMQFDVPLVALRGISDGKADLHHVDDWTEYLHIIDEKLAEAVDRLEAVLAGDMDWPAV